MAYHLFIRSDDEISYKKFDHEYKLHDYLEDYDLNNYYSVCPDDLNMSEFPGYSYLLIEGKILHPKPVEVVTKWSFE